MNKFPKADIGYCTEGCGPFFICPACFLLLEEDQCPKCGQIYDISIEDR